ncbi:hypothetical protein E2C01_067547 [Portunus trituberculatus]|uniref:Uncharacterized protein n=1 Tax=Portunus trituberculatus TaxID=210409 RepID=A0A5B7HTW7_PORTR|nr:hypothetical protein [Portunus trituberculatus]
MVVGAWWWKERIQCFMATDPVTWDLSDLTDQSRRTRETRNKAPVAAAANLFHQQEAGHG